MKTIIQLFEENVEKYINNPFLWEKKTDKFNSITYIETQKLAHTFAAGLLSLGVKHGDRIALLSEGRNAWIIAELGLFHTGAINVPLSIKLTPPELEFRLNHSETSIVIVSKTQSKKIKEIYSGLKTVKTIIYLDDSDDLADNEINISDIYKSGENYLGKNYTEFLERKNEVKGSDYANIAYTSGTTADPKGVILTHRNYTANVEQALTLMNIPQYFKTLIILPLDHCFAHVAGIYSFMAMGASIGTIQTGKTPAETLKNIPINIKEFKPNIMLSVPALAKNFRKNIESAIKAKGPKVEKLFNKAMNLAYKYNGDGFSKSKWSILTRLKLRIYDKILFSKIRENFGGEMKFFIGGGAVLDVDLQQFFCAIGIPMFQGYGLSEATPIISSNSLEKHKFGSSGYLVKPIDLKICDEKGNEVPIGQKGEIVVKGENVMAGYWKNEQATNETIKDGKLYTGDLGYMDKDGFLYVFGRFKSLLISCDGEKYSPESIEESLTEKCEYIDQSMLYNNQSQYTIGLIVPQKDSIRRAVQKAGLDIASHEAKTYALQLIQQDINMYKKGGIYENIFPERWLPSSIAVLCETFNEENKLMNSTMKIIRPKVTEYFKHRIDYLYTPEGKNILNEHNLISISNILTKKC